MSKRRGNNEGSIYFHKPSGKWSAQVTLQGRRLTKYFDSQKECRDWIRETTSQIDQGLTYTAARITTGDYLGKWLKSVEPSLRPKTFIQYSQIVRDHISPFIGKIKLKDLRPDQIQTLYSYRLGKGFSPRTVELVHAVLRRALNQALAWGLIGRNPIKGVNKPKVPKKEMKFYEEEEIKLLLSAVEETRYSALYHIAVTTGLRQGELLALKWSDIDWENKRFQVQRQIQRIPGKGKVFTEPKTKAGKRVVAIGDLTIKKLSEHKEIQNVEKAFAGERWEENELIFPSSIGTPQEPRNILRHFKITIEKLGLPEIRFHDLRHSAASLMLRQGVHPKVVQERLGHSSISLTLDVYSHVIPSIQEDVANSIDLLLMKNKIY